MQASPSPSQPLSLTSLLPTVVQWGFGIVGFAVVLLVISQNVDINFSAREVKTELHYKGHVLLDLTKPKDK